MIQIKLCIFNKKKIIIIIYLFTQKFYFSIKLLLALIWQTDIYKMFLSFANSQKNEKKIAL